MFAQQLSLWLQRRGIHAALVVIAIRRPLTLPTSPTLRGTGAAR